MSRKSVAVLDIRSHDIAVFVGERGVNGSFVFKANKVERYMGYGEGTFNDEEALFDAVFRAVSFVEKVIGARLKELYIGVPGEFVRVIAKRQETGFSKRRKIGQKELDMLCASGIEEVEGYTFIRASSVYYTTADNRRTVDPEGIVSTGITGDFSYFYCSDYFIGKMEKFFGKQKITLRYLPTQLALANFLIPSETRDEHALLLDAGTMSTTISVVLGNGVLAQKTFGMGTGQFALPLKDKFPTANNPLNQIDGAIALLCKANLYAKTSDDVTEFLWQNVPHEISTQKLVTTAKEGLNELCELVSAFLDQYQYLIPALEYKPIYVTGEGICKIRGALEYISKWLSRVCEQIVPDVPYYNKPEMSSRIALLDMAYEDNRKRGAIYRLINGFGG